jgi:hypothetical protein
MDMEEGDTIEVFTQQSGGKMEQVHSINVNYDKVKFSSSRSKTFEGCSNASLIVYKRLLPSGLPKSKL